MRISGANVATVSGTIITASAMNVVNTFQKPDGVVPRPFDAAAMKAGVLSVRLPEKSIVMLALH